MGILNCRVNVFFAIALSISGVKKALLETKGARNGYSRIHQRHG